MSVYQSFIIGDGTRPIFHELQAYNVTNPTWFRVNAQWFSRRNSRVSQPSIWLLVISLKILPLSRLVDNTPEHNCFWDVMTGWRLDRSPDPGCAFSFSALFLFHRRRKTLSSSTWWIDSCDQSFFDSSAHESSAGAQFKVFSVQYFPTCFDTAGAARQIAPGILECWAWNETPHIPVITFSFF